MDKRVLLCIMDGWGISSGSEKYDATKLAHPVNVPKLEKEEKFIQIHADGENVGLPEGQMGNSEVGHLNLGAGRIVYQDLSKINNAIKDGSFFKNERFLNAVEHVKKYDSALHIYGLVSTGGVHSSLDHVLALIQFAAQNGIEKFYVHAFLDGRDTPPSSACEYLQIVEDELKKFNLPPVATAVGRYYIMDRDNRWERVEKGYNALLLGEGNHASSVIEGVKKSYEEGITDEFVLPVIAGGDESRIHDNDAIIFFNFRPDRAREITKAINFADFTGFERRKVLKNILYTTMTSYEATFDFPVAFPKEKLVNILGDVLEANGINQFRTAETEKYAHVTFFFNGSKEKQYNGEDRILVPSPKVETYDMKPEMSAGEVTEKVIEAIRSKKYDAIILNYANPDMVGHTGSLEAAIKAIEFIDECVGKVVKAITENEGVLLITADHGNADYAVNDDGTPNTAHSLNDVPFIVVNAGDQAKEVKDGKLADVAPTILKLMGIEQPAAMTGQPLV
jgi:2,3-bisphosphoglycerate-independent phosphoglycerate mutase